MVRQPQFIRSRFAVRTLLAEDVSFPENEPTIFHDEDGAPFLIDSDWRVSLSHAGDVALAAVSPVALGVDIESIRPYREGWAETFLSRDEQVWVREHTQKGLEHGLVITVYWSIKEAYLKALRVGLRLHPNRVICYIDWQRLTCRIVCKGHVSARGIFSLEPDGYVAAGVVLATD